MVNPGKSELEKINSLQRFIIQNVHTTRMSPTMKCRQMRSRLIKGVTKKS